MALLSTMLDRVHDEFPAVPEAVALRALADSFKEFCTRTHAWQELLPTIRVRAGRTEFELSPDTGTMVVALKDVRVNGERIPPIPAELPRVLTTVLSSSSKPLGFTQIRSDTFVVVNPVDADVQVKATAALTLTQGYTEYDIPDVLVDEWAEGLAAGAKARLVMQAGQPWFAPDAAPLYGRQFYAATRQAKARAAFALGEADLQVQMRSW